MMRQYELVERVLAYNPDADEDILNRAYVYAMKAHGGQLRASGDPFFSHPIEVAAILTTLKLDDATIAAALLHDVVEDTTITRRNIEATFGEEIAFLVESLTKIKNLEMASREAAQGENLRKLLMAVARDVRVLLIKLADRLHNMRSIGHLSEPKRRRISQETLDIYAPLAGRMGLAAFREELEDIAFQALNPKAYDMISLRLEALRRESGDILRDIARAVQASLARHDVTASVAGREKKPYSIWCKMERKSLSLSQLSDIFGFRVIVGDVADCYRALGVIHTAWRAVPERFKDYISNPKDNDYRSLHTTVIGPHYRRVELQIRTREMDMVAEKGLAAHDFYKDVTLGDAPGNPLKTYEQLRSYLEDLTSGDYPHELLAHSKLDLFQNQVFCFTPKGDLIALPPGANAIDFAYAVHTGVGDSCVGCRINGKHAPLLSELSNGDEVEISCSKGQRPSPVWRELVRTARARAAINRATREDQRKQFSGLGERILRGQLEQIGEVYAIKKVEKALQRLGLERLDDGLAAIGRAEISVTDVVRAMGFEPDQQRKLMPKRSAVVQDMQDGTGEARDFVLAGVTHHELPVRISAATGAVPGERIVGIRTPGEAITVFPIFSRALRKMEKLQGELWLDMSWEMIGHGDGLYPARLEVLISNEVGALAQVTRTISEHQANIENMRMIRRAHDFYALDVVVELCDVAHLNSVIAGLRAQSLVSKAERATG